MATVKSETNDSTQRPDSSRRKMIMGGGMAAATMLFAGVAKAEPTSGRNATVDGIPVPMPPEDKTAGPIVAGRDTKLAGRVAVVTGAARGIGRAIAVEYAANGADVIAIDIAAPVTSASSAVPATPDDLAETIRMIKAYGGRAEGIRADIRDVAALRAVAEGINERFGKIDIVVANAAVQYWKPLLELQDSEWHDVIDNNLNGTANTIRVFAPKMVARNYGRIIVISSMQGRHGSKDAASYSASKWGIFGLMKSAALELGRYNITVNAITPGLVGTALTFYDARLSESIGETGYHKPNGPLTPQEAWDRRAATMPLGVAWLQPEDISPAAVYLASEGAAMITGAEIEVTGGDSAKSI
ncbi:SDR family NAD(P)-dependent oxidoreductase [Paraburkholderia sp. BR10937]|uniref:SDR family NAD(P)-dependent oxidoreductase n=1 Tax=Paraburkholderia sp. BR10937 TaxID=3236994 RepID=UPI0034D2BF63